MQSIKDRNKLIDEFLKTEELFGAIYKETNIYYFKFDNGSLTSYANDKLGKKSVILIKGYPLGNLIYNYDRVFRLD